MIALGLAGVIEVVSVSPLAGFSGLVDDIVSGAAGSAEADKFDATTSQIAGAYLLVLIVAGIAYVAWLSRSVEDAPALGAGTPPHSPLVVRAIRELRGAVPDRGRSPRPSRDGD